MYYYSTTKIDTSGVYSRETQFMEYYCIMVLTGDEKNFKDRAIHELKELFPATQFYYFERKLHTKRRGWVLGSLFPGYLFFGVEDLSAEFFFKLRKIKGFCRILPDNQSPLSIQGSALEELKFLIQNGEVLGISKVQFLPGQNVKAISGPLKGYEGSVVMVNKKKKIITVRSLLTKDGKMFDLNYEEAEKTGESN